MNQVERAAFLDAIAETAKVIKLAQAALQRARSQCHGEIFNQVDLMSKRLYELKVKSEWLRHVALGKIELPVPPTGTESRQDEDRRQGLDRRVASMQSQILAVPAATAVPTTA